MDLKLRPKEECKFDEISLGEIMLRLDPGEGRIKTSRTFRAWEGAASITWPAAAPLLWYAHRCGHCFCRE